MYIIQTITADRAIIREILPGSSSSIGYSTLQGPCYLPIAAGHTCEIETTAMRLLPIQQGRTYKVSGCWMNYTKQNPPVFVLALTSAQLIEMPVPQPATT